MVTAQGICRDRVTQLRSRSSRQQRPWQSGFAGAHEAPRAARHVHVHRRKGEQRAGADTTVLRTSVQGRAGARGAARGFPHSSPALRGHRDEPPTQHVGCRQLPGWSPGVGRRLSNLPASPGVRPGIKNTAAASSSLHETAKGPLATLLLPAPTGEGGCLPRTHPPPQSHGECREPCLGISDLSSKHQPGSAQCFQRRAAEQAPCKHRARLLSPPGHAIGSGLPESSWVLQTAVVTLSRQKHPPSLHGHLPSPGDLGGVRDRGQPGFSCPTPSWGPHPCQGTRVMEWKEIPAKTLILFFKNKKNPKTDKTS